MPAIPPMPAPDRGAAASSRHLPQRVHPSAGRGDPIPSLRDAPAMNADAATPSRRLLIVDENWW